MAQVVVAAVAADAADALASGTTVSIVEVSSLIRRCWRRLAVSSTTACPMGHLLLAAQTNFKPAWTLPKRKRQCEDRKSVV